MTERPFIIRDLGTREGNHVKGPKTRAGAEALAATRKQVVDFRALTKSILLEQEIALIADLARLPRPMKAKRSCAARFRDKLKRNWNVDPQLFAMKRLAFKVGNLPDQPDVGLWRFPDGSEVKIANDSSKVFDARRRRK